MAGITYAAIPFIRSDTGPAPGEPVECDGASLAILIAKALARRQDHSGVAYSRTSDMQGDQFSDVVVLARFGEVPGDLTVLY
jgi:hypothetical protein